MKEKEKRIVTLAETIRVCIHNPDFMNEYRRLSKSNVGKSSGITAMIDKATGYDKKQAKDLFDFIRDYIWLPSQMPLIKEEIMKDLED